MALTLAHLASTVCVLAMGLTACQDTDNSGATGRVQGVDTGGNAPPNTAASTSTLQEAAAPDVPLGGSWIAHYDRRRATKTLKAAGLGTWAESFFEAEAWPPAGESMTTVYTFTPSEGEPRAWHGTFAVAYFEAGDIWHVGWRGPAEVSGNKIEMYDDYSQTTDVYRWRVDGDELTLRKVRSDAELHKGIPLEVYDTAYLTSPLIRTDCPMDPGTDCPE
jgi:hypothetical protein